MDILEPKKPLKTYVNPQNTPSERPKERKRNVIVIKRQVLTTKNAVELLLSGKLKSKVCRYCLHITAPLSELDQIMQIADKGALYKVTIRDIVASFHPIKVVDDPNIPNKICEKCLDKAVQSYLFAQKCEQSERALRNCFEDMYDKLEKLDPLERVKKRGRQKLHPNHNILYTENRNVIDYAEPIHNLINVATVSLTNEPVMGDLECKKCWQVLPNVESLANHEKIHPNSMWYNCRICGKSFSKKIHIRRHARMHAKGKILNLVEKGTDFVCKQCGHSSNNHDVHLQHIEKHKFQTVLEHLVERKMDKLCSVCLSNRGNLIEMDKMICLHGGYPELTGDRSLYNILGATIPEPKHKYQELVIAQKPIIMTITKKPKNVEPAAKENDDFILSSPQIISMENKQYEDNYVSIFSEPVKLPQMNTPEIKMSEDETDNENYEYPKNYCDTDETASSTSIEIIDTDVLIEEIPEQQNQNKIKTVKFNFSNPDYAIDNINILPITKEKRDTDNSNNNKYCSKCWIFKQLSCNSCFQNKEAETQKEIKNDLIQAKNIISEPCQYCWIFKNVGKCAYCNKPTNKTENLLQNIETDTTAIKCDVPIIKKNATKRKSDDMDTETPKKAKWQCKICLITNNIDRQTCVCCQSEKVYEEKVKLNLSYNFTDFMKITSPNTKESVDINLNNSPNENVEAKTMVDAEKSTEKEKAAEIQRNESPSIEMMESKTPFDSNSQDSNIPKYDILGETMEITIDDNDLPDAILTVQEKPLFIIPKVVNVPTTPTIQEPISPFGQYSMTFNPNPFSTAAFPAPENDSSRTSQINLQFNIGSVWKEEKKEENKFKGFRRFKKFKSIRK